MKFYADTSFLGNLYFDDQRFTGSARRIRDRFQLRPVVSSLAKLELRIATLSKDESVWELFLREIGEGKMILVPSPNGDIVWQQVHSLIEQNGR